MAPENKLKEMIKYIVENYEEPQVLTRTKLVKLLYLSDKFAKEELGSKISDTDYIKYHYGPYSDDIVDTLEEMDGEGISELVGQTSSGKYYQYVPLHANVTGRLSNQEKAIIDRILNNYADLDTEALVDEVYTMYNLDDEQKYTHLL